MNTPDPFGHRKAWTAREEATLQEAQALTAKLLERRALAIAKVSDALDAASIPATGFNVDQFILHAGAIRDALEPFDDGVRSAQNAPG